MLTYILHHLFSGSWWWVQQLQGREASLFEGGKQNAVDYDLLMSVAELHSEREHHCSSRVSTEVTSIQLFFYYLVSCISWLRHRSADIDRQHGGRPCSFFFLHVKCDGWKLKLLTLTWGLRLQAHRTWPRCADVCQCADVFFCSRPNWQMAEWLT